MNTEKLLWRVFVLGIVASAMISVPFVLSSFLPDTASDSSNQPLSIGCSSSGVEAVDHNTSYRPNVIVENQSRITDASVVEGSGFNLRLSTKGRIIDATAQNAAGDSVLLSHNENETVISQPDDEPFRIVMDSVQNGTVFRTELDICPGSD